MESLTNPSWKVIITAIVVLVILRLALGRSKSHALKQIAEISESIAIAIFLVFLIIRPFLIQAYFIPSGSMHPTLIEGDRILVSKFVYRFREPRYGDVVVFKSPPKAEKDEADFIKRVMGLPGDRIKVTPGYVLVDDVQLRHPELHAKLMDYGRATTPVDVTVKLASDRVYVDGKEVTKRDIAMAIVHRPDARVIIHPGAVYRNEKKLEEPYIAEDPDEPYPLDGSVLTVPRGSIFVMGDNRNNSLDSRSWGLLSRKRIEGKAMFIFWPFDRIRWVR